jgi:glyoxylase-like metal-dependent hydrolase (beta-lactamase superfamily II)
VLGNDFIANKYGLTLEAHAGEVPVLASCERVAMMYGIPYSKSPEIGFFLSEGDEIAVGNISLKVLFCPGHSPASICLYSENDKKLIAGDVLFHRSIGRTDLPGGDYNTLINSIETKLWPLPDSVNVYPGHGIPTTIGFEKRENPFLNE